MRVRSVEHILYRIEQAHLARRDVPAEMVERRVFGFRRQNREWRGIVRQTSPDQPQPKGDRQRFGMRHNRFNRAGNFDASAIRAEPPAMIGTGNRPITHFAAGQRHRAVRATIHQQRRRAIRHEQHQRHTHQPRGIGFVAQLAQFGNGVPALCHHFRPCLAHNPSFTIANLTIARLTIPFSA